MKDNELKKLLDDYFELKKQRSIIQKMADNLASSRCNTLIKIKCVNYYEIEESKETDQYKSVVFDFGALILPNPYFSQNKKESELEHELLLKIVISESMSLKVLQMINTELSIKIDRISKKIKHELSEFV